MMPPPLSIRRVRAWLSGTLLATAAIPVAAQCAADIEDFRASNEKSLAFLSDACSKTAALAPAAAPERVARPAPQQPSALERIRMRQEGSIPEPAAAPAAALVDAQTDFQTEAKPDCASIPPAQRFDTNSELGTAAIPVDHTFFDDRWDRVRRAPPTWQMRAELQKAGARRGISDDETLKRVNQWVNHRITYVSDDRNHGQSDVWATASETIAHGSGDCEDFAILKMQLLRAAGIDGDRIKLVLLRDLVLGADHAILLVRTGTGWVALDNMTDSIYDGSQPNAVRPIMSFSGGRRWVHGYLDQPYAHAFASTLAAAKPLTASGASDTAARAVRIAHKTDRFAKEQDDVLASGLKLPRFSWQLGSGT